ncbi:shikimate dehydrogenase family protein [Filimonas effusa]|uniref:Shikimate dehydrogenase n=1 Tax=Filimonas effusa TaxID=2508721 RepID=A0A4Q1D0R6_9BACT|nr:shikimate dehydrogenase [Filimonas effusa]RXK81344.1 shikimate dehydrogenase [Filimonas effusa]
MRTFGILGYPLTHSFSQRYFEEKFQREAVTDAQFKLFSCPDIASLPQMLAAEPALEGFCITIPHKKSILPWLTEADEVVTAMGACNCVRIRNGKLYGYNTDVAGFETSFTAQLQPHHTRALILGTGGAAAAVQYILQKKEIPYHFVSRQQRPGHFTYDHLSPEVIATHPVIINCTPLGTYPDVQTSPDLPYHLLTPNHYLYDLVYNPPLTRFLQLGQQQGAIIKNGYDMLVIQAEANWQIWNS